MNREQIENLLNRYLDGDTTNEEEEQLRQYFADTQIVPQEWKIYKALFCWEDNQRNSVTSDCAVPASKSGKYRMAIAASIAALLIMGAGITTMLLRSSDTEQQAGQQLAYENALHSENYAVLDGRYTTDADVIAREVEEALLLVSATDADTFDAIDILSIP